MRPLRGLMYRYHFIIGMPLVMWWKLPSYFLHITYSIIQLFNYSVILVKAESPIPLFGKLKLNAINNICLTNRINATATRRRSGMPLIRALSHDRKWSCYPITSDRVVRTERTASARRLRGFAEAVWKWFFNTDLFIYLSSVSNIQFSERLKLFSHSFLQSVCHAQRDTSNRPAPAPGLSTFTSFEIGRFRLIQIEKSNHAYMYIYNANQALKQH